MLLSPDPATAGPGLLVFPMYTVAPPQTLTAPEGRLGLLRQGFAAQGGRPSTDCAPAAWRLEITATPEPLFLARLLQKL